MVGTRVPFTPPPPPCPLMGPTIPDLESPRGLYSGGRGLGVQCSTRCACHWTRTTLAHACAHTVGASAFLGLATVHGVLVCCCCRESRRGRAQDLLLRNLLLAAADVVPCPGGQMKSRMRVTVQMGWSGFTSRHSSGQSACHPEAWPI